MRGALRWACLGLAACAGGNSAYSCSGYKEPFVLEPGTVQVVNPVDELQGGRTVAIEWHTGDPVDHVDVAILRAGTAIATQAAVENSGTFMWRVPIDLETADDYTIRVTYVAGEMTATDESEPFTIRNWKMRREIAVTRGDDAYTGRAVLELPASDPAVAASGEEGAELRFAADAERSEGSELGYWIEYWDGRGARIWVTLPAQGNSIFMFWDSPGAELGSDIEQVMPSRWESPAGQSHINEPNLVTDAFIVHADDIVKLTAGGPLVVDASLIWIKGTLDASGSGYSGQVGPGFGDDSVEAAGGGGAYGGFGGDGGAVYPEQPGIGGDPYGASDDDLVDMGSGGGRADFAYGGSGGGRIELYGTRVVLEGYVFADGMNGPGGGGSCGGGGGAGGGIYVWGDVIELSGTLSASGGFGGGGAPIDAHHGGGGGGGGRIKLMYTDVLDNRGTTRANGGVGGSGYMPGEPGAPGSIHTDQVTWSPTRVEAGATTTLY